MKKKSISIIEIEDAWAELKPAYGIEISLRFLEENPNSSRALIYLSYFYTHLRRFNKALSILKRAIRSLGEDNEKLAEAYIAMGFIFREKGNYKVAERWYRKALELEPNNPSHHQDIGEILSLQGDFSEAEIYFNTVLNLPTDRVKEQAYYELGLIQKSKGKYKEALLLFDKAAELGIDQECVDEERIDVKEAIKVIEGG